MVMTKTADDLPTDTSYCPVRRLLPTAAVAATTLLENPAAVV